MSESKFNWVDNPTASGQAICDTDILNECLMHLKYDNAGGGGLEIGDIGIAPLGIDETKGKRRYLNGQVIIQDQYVQFTNKVKSAVALYPSLACTESEWQTTATMTVGGQVGKFVVDDEAGTIRLPKIIMPIQGLTDLSKLAEIVEAGLPNITGGLDGVVFDLKDAQQKGALTKSASVGTYCGSGSGESHNNITFDASLSNSIYGKSNTVQQEQIQYPYFIQVATGAETEDNIINEIELNNPYSFGDSKYSPVALNNLSWLKSEGQWNSKAVYPAYYDWALINANNGVEGFALSTGEYTDYDVVINPADETFRLPLLDGSEDLPSDKYIDLTLEASGSTCTAPANGYIIFKTTSNTEDSTNHYIQFTVNNKVYGDSVKGYTMPLYVSFEVKKGDVIKIEYVRILTPTTYNFIYAQGNGSLYFYVGETVQNANLVNIGRIQETMVTNTMVDGQWVTKSLDLMTSFPASSIQSFDLSEYLPNDGYNYEVMITGFGATGASSGQYLSIFAHSDILLQKTCIFRAITRTSSTAFGGGTVVIPAQKTILIENNGDASSGTNRLTLVAYRRLGTNA